MWPLPFGSAGEQIRMGPMCPGRSNRPGVGSLRSVLNLISGLFCLARLTSVVLAASAANAADLYRLEDVIDKPLMAAIEEFPGGAITYSARPSRPLYELHGGAACRSFYSTLSRQKRVRRFRNSFWSRPFIWSSATLSALLQPERLSS